MRLPLPQASVLGLGDVSHCFHGRVVSAHIFWAAQASLFAASTDFIFMTLAMADDPMATTITTSDTHVGTSGTQETG